MHVKRGVASGGTGTFDDGNWVKECKGFVVFASYETVEQRPCDMITI